MVAKGQSPRLLDVVKTRGVVTCFDVIRPNKGTHGIMTPLPLYVGYFMPYLEEVAYIAGSHASIEVKSFFMHRIRACMLKDGARSVYLIKRDRFQRVSACVLQSFDFTD